MNLNNIRLSAKLWLATGFIVVGLCVVTGYTAARSAADRAAGAAALDALNTKITLTTRWAALTQTNAARSQAVLLSSDPAVEAGLKDAVAATWAQIDDLQKSIDASQLTPADRAQIEKIASNRKTVLESRAAVMKLRSEGKPEEVAAAINNQYLPAMELYQKSQREFVALQVEAGESSRLFYVQRAKELVTLGVIGM